VTGQRILKKFENVDDWYDSVRPYFPEERLSSAVFHRITQSASSGDIGTGVTTVRRRLLFSRFITELFEKFGRIIV
jgi:hypothetical protein